MNDKPPFLVQQEHRLSIKEAETIVDNILKKLDIKFNSLKEEKKKYFELVNQVRQFGICRFIQDELDKQDPVFGRSFGMSTPNWGMTMTTEWAGYKKMLTGPCRNTPSELELSEDIEFYKQETCIESSNYDFEMVSRNYRGYLFSSIALIDCYINIHIILFDYIGPKSAEFENLKNSRNTEERIELFVKIACEFPFSELKQSKAWNDFKKLKNLRNEIVHSLSPYMGFEIKELATNLNLSINGVGSLLKKLQEGQGRNTLGFIERVRTSPVIHFNQITIRADGKHHEKRHFNKISR